MGDFYVEKLASILGSIKATGTFDDLKKLKEQIEISNVIQASIAVLNNQGYSSFEQSEILKSLKDYATPTHVSNVLRNVKKR